MPATAKPAGRPLKHSDDLRDKSRVVSVYATAMELKLLDSLRCEKRMSRSAYLCWAIRHLAGYQRDGEVLIEDRVAGLDPARANDE